MKVLAVLPNVVFCVSVYVTFFFEVLIQAYQTVGHDIYVSPFRVGRHIVFPLASVHLSVTKLNPLYKDILMKLHTFVKHIETSCHAQEP